MKCGVDLFNGRLNVSCWWIGGACRWVGQWFAYLQHCASSAREVTSCSLPPLFLMSLGSTSELMDEIFKCLCHGIFNEVNVQRSFEWRGKIAHPTATRNRWDEKSFRLGRMMKDDSSNENVWWNILYASLPLCNGSAESLTYQAHMFT